MMTKRLAWLALVCLVGSCEPPRSKNPLSAPETAKADARLAGVWAGRVGDHDEALLQFVPREGARVDLVITGRDHDSGAVVLAFEGFPSVIGGKSYLNLRAKSYSGRYGEKTAVADRWIFARYDFAKDGTFTLSEMDDPLVKAAVAAGKLDGDASVDPIELTASSASLAAFVAGADSATLFKRFGSFKRARVDYPK